MDKLSFMIDQNLNDARTFLVSIIQDKSSDNRTRELSMKLIFLLGLARSNVEDFLIVAQLLGKEEGQVDLRKELSLIKNSLA